MSINKQPQLTYSAMNQQQHRVELWQRGVLFLLYAAFLLFFCSRNSPFFPYQVWVDPNIYMDVGKAISQGKVLYLEVFDHKGPLLLLAFAVLAKISQQSMIGLYFLQSVTLSISLWYLYRTARLFSSKNASLWICLIFPLLLLGFQVYGQGGGSAEELLLPCFFGGIYYVIRSFIKVVEPNLHSVVTDDNIMLYATNHISRFGFFPLGVFAGILLMVKLNLAAFILAGASFVFLSLVLDKKGRFFLAGLWRFMAGLALIILPILFYFLINDGLGAFWEVYIRFNLIYASQASEVSGNSIFLMALLRGTLTNALASLCIILGLIAVGTDCLPMTRLGKITYSIMLVVLAVAIYIPGRAYAYEYIPLLSFVGVGEIGLYLMMGKILKSLTATTNNNLQSAGRGAIPNPNLHKTVFDLAFKAITSVILVVFLVGFIIYSNGLYTYSRPFHQEKTGVEKIAQTLRNTWSRKDKSPSLLLFNSGDYGFFQLSGTYPMLRVFYMPMIQQSIYPGLAQAQISYIAQGLPDYVVQSLYQKPKPTDISPVITINSQYVLIDQQVQPVENVTLYISLYKRSGVKSGNLFLPKQPALNF